jgi:hypothetical protein
VKRKAETRKIKELRKDFFGIEFPDYQREPTVWDLEQKQRLIDSILRRFDISAIYLYERDDGSLECIDGRQRLNAIMSFLGDNLADEDDNGFAIRIENEVADDVDDSLEQLQGVNFEQLEQGEDTTPAEEILNYEVTTVLLSGSRAVEEFNLQFLRLNLGTLINAGEKLHAMVGVMRDLIFKDKRLGKHPFLQRTGVPTRRYAQELIAAQLMLQVSSKAGPDGRPNPERQFTRGRHFDLQRYVKSHAQEADQQVDEVTAALNVMEEHAAEVGESLRNRAICVSVVLGAWDLNAAQNEKLAKQYGEFLKDFLKALKKQVEKMKDFSPDPDLDYLTVFQRHLTQASVEKPAITYRHVTLLEQFAVWRDTGGKLTGQD